MRENFVLLQHEMKEEWRMRLGRWNRSWQFFKVEDQHKLRLRGSVFDLETIKTLAKDCKCPPSAKPMFFSILIQWPVKNTIILACQTMSIFSNMSIIIYWLWRRTALFDLCSKMCFCNSWCISFQCSKHLFSTLHASNTELGKEESSFFNKILILQLNGFVNEYM